MRQFLEELIAYFALDASDRAMLVALHPVLAPELPAIADAFYAVARSHPNTAAILSDPELSVRLRGSLIDWMSSGLLGPYDDVFIARRARIGSRHIAIGLAQHDMIAAMTVIRSGYRDRIALGCPPAELSGRLRAVDKMLDIELSLMLRHYQLDSEARLVDGERKRRLEQVDAMRTLCAGLAHEVRNPVNSAKLQLELADRRLRRGGDDPRVVEPIELAVHEIDRLTVLLDEFLAFARPPALDRHPRDVVALVRDVVELGRGPAARRGARLTLVDSEPIIAEVDAPKLHQIIDSLVANAIEAVTAGGHVTIAVVPIAADIHVRVTDDGPGIPPDVLPRIYDPFFSTKEGGTGMGLSIVHSLVALHRGKIEVTSSPDGTTFDVAVPRRGQA